MKIHIPHFDKARELVVGDVMLDRYWHGATSRISPEAPVPEVRVEAAEDRTGGAANVALTLATLGAHNLADFEAVVGHCRSEDELVDRGMALLAAQNFEALLITRGEHGMTLLQRGREALHLPARAREVCDVPGAGDPELTALTDALETGE